MILDTALQRCGKISEKIVNIISNYTSVTT